MFNLMLKAGFISLLAVCLLRSAQAQQAPDPQKSAQAAPRQTGAGFIAPSEANVRIAPDVRTFIVMAALNMAGFDYETGGQPLSPARAELRKDLARLDPQVKAKLAAFYGAHKRQGLDETADAARYEALSMMMTEPPGFTVYQATDRAIPDDLQPLLARDGDLTEGFVSLVREFYLKSGIRELIPKYMAIGQAYATAYRGPVGIAIYD